jgi:hypothetical protein
VLIHANRTRSLDTISEQEIMFNISTCAISKDNQLHTFLQPGCSFIIKVQENSYQINSCSKTVKNTVICPSDQLLTLHPPFFSVLLLHLFTISRTLVRFPCLHLFFIFHPLSFYRKEIEKRWDNFMLLGCHFCNIYTLLFAHNVIM